MEQISLFEEQKQKKQEQIVTISKAESFVNCPKCNCQPITWHKMVAVIDGGSQMGTGAKCPVCGYSCFTLYNIVVQWNDCQKYRLRDELTNL